MNLIAERKAQTLAKDSSLLQNSIDYFQRLDIGTAQIKDAAITDAKIVTLAVSKLTAGTMTADVTIANTFKTAASPNQRIEITSAMIAGYSDATTKQFYLQASDGKAYCGAGNVILDSSGIQIKGAGTGLQIYDATSYIGVLYSSASGIVNLYAVDNKLVLDGTPININSVGALALISDVGINTYSSHYLKLPSNTSPSAEGQISFDYISHLLKYHNGTAEKTVATTTDITTVATDTIWDEQGDVVYGTGANTGAVLAHGTTGQYLETQGHGANPTWTYSTSHTTQQTQADFTPDRAIDTIYQNTSGKTMIVHVAGFRNNSVTLTAYSDTNATPALVVAQSADYSTGETCTTGITWIVPNNYYYKVTPGASGFTLSYWTEWVIG